MSNHHHDKKKKNTRPFLVIVVFLLVLGLSPSSSPASSNVFCSGFFKSSVSSSSQNTGLENLPNLLAPKLKQSPACISTLRITVNGPKTSHQQHFVLRWKSMVTLADLQEQIEKKLGKGIEISNHYYDCELRRVVVSSTGPGRRDEDASATLLASSSEFVTSETCTLIDDLGLQDGDEVSVKVILSRPRAPRHRAVDHLQFTIHGKHYTLPEPITTVYELRQWIHKLSGIHVSQQGDLVGCNTTRDYTAVGGYTGLFQGY